MLKKGKEMKKSEFRKLLDMHDRASGMFVATEKVYTNCIYLSVAGTWKHFLSKHRKVDNLDKAVVKYQRWLDEWKNKKGV